jgi:hypothetical protein
MAQAQYVPGVCNIGPEEIARRRNLGWIGLVVAIVVFAALLWSGVDAWWRLFVFFPAALSASGFLQAYFQFCTGFARAGIFNFGSLGTQQTVGDDSSKAKDKRQGSRITLYAVLIGFIVALAAVLL